MTLSPRAPAMRRTAGAVLAFTVLLAPAVLGGQERPRARDLGIPFPGDPGPVNAITDVEGVRVGHTTIIEGDGVLVEGEGPVRTGVTAVIPRTGSYTPVFAGWYSLNGNGEMTGTTWVEESGFLEGPVMITNTHSVGIVHDAVIEWSRDARAHLPISPGIWWSLPVVAETWDGWLNDINGFHVTKEHAFQAIDAAASGPVVEGAVGGWDWHGLQLLQGWDRDLVTPGRRLHGRCPGPMQLRAPPRPPCRRYSGGAGAARLGASDQRIVRASAGGRRVDHRGRRDRRAAAPTPAQAARASRPRRDRPHGRLRQQQLRGHLSSPSRPPTPRPGTASRTRRSSCCPTTTSRRSCSRPAQATEEAITNAMIAARTMVGRDGHVVHGLPHEEVRRILARHNRLRR